MVLKYLEIQGFKSFPDKVKIELYDGITAVVGPNGSGKSNISDAIRWVMGEQSAKTLRGGKMEDVIFAGTEKRKPVGFAEVSVCFDNSMGLFKIDFAEVLITRRYFRSGESEYYINKSSCRLRDIHELLMDTGMGRDGYSVVGQGKIDEIITSKPEDRRMIFEEAAGISKYRYRKAESEKKMQQTHENLLRLLDLISELETRLGPLEADADKAKKYLTYRDELKEIEISLSLQLIDQLKEAISRSEELLKLNQTGTEETNALLAQLEESAQALRDTAKEAEQKQEAAVEELHTLQSGIQNLENQISLLNNSQSFHQENNIRLQNEIAHLEEETESIKEQVLAKTAQLAELREKAVQAQEQLTAHQQAYQKLTDTLSLSTKELEQVNQDIMDAIHLVSEKKANLASHTTALEGLKQRAITVQEDIGYQKDDLEDNQKRIDHEKEALAQAKTQLNQQTQRLKEAEEAGRKLEQELGILQDRVNRATVDLEQAASRKKMLEDLERDMEGYSHSVKSVISENAKGRLAHIKIYGTVSKVIGVTAAYTTAIEAALGGNIQNIITQTEEDAKAAIQFLKSTKGGRATFLPISAVKGKRLDTKEFSHESGYLGLACDLVTCDGKFQGIVDDLLGRTLVLDTIDHGISFAKKYKYRYKLVTLEGEIFNAGGSITGGNMGRSSSFLSRKSQIKELGEKISCLQEQKEQAADALEKCGQKGRDAEAKRKELELSVHQMENDVFKFQYNLDHFESLSAQITQELEELLVQQEKNSQQKEQLEASKGKLMREIAEEEEKITALQEKTQTLQDQNSGHSSEVSRLSSKVVQFTMKLAEYEEDEKQVMGNRAELEERVKSLHASIDAKRMEMENAGGQDSEIAEKIQALQKNIEEKRKLVSKSEVEIAQIKELRVKTETAVFQTQAAEKEANEKIVLLSKEQGRIENKKVRQETELEHIINRLWEDYELTYLSAQPYRKEIENQSEVQKKVNGLKGQIKALGAVNIGAIDEYKETKERFDFLTNQKNDLENAKSTLEHVISDMEALMVKQFRQQLTIINDTFREVFTDLFSGGTAELVLTDEADILAAGVEIHAQPPGKKLQNMTLFSGGEKAIIAIALLFALLKVRPSPLVVLDEIEAALDDVNVARFAAYLRKISERSQIAIITHRRGTMEEADVLYGVTMQEKGVSKLLQLNIDEVERNIQQAN